MCGRCLALKDKVVGHTDEDGVTLPPLHPRCRCAIMYREVAETKLLPQIIINNYRDVAKPRRQMEFMSLANQLKPMIEQHSGRMSKWNGKLVFENGGAPGNKLWDCSIRLNPDLPIHGLIHELIHSCSVSHYGKKVWCNHIFEEKLTVHYLSQELAVLENIPVASSGYDAGVELIREFKRELGIKMSDLKFASALVKEDLGYRWEWLAERIMEILGVGVTIEKYNYFMSKLEAIRQWLPKT